LYENPFAVSDAVEAPGGHRPLVFPRFSEMFARSAALRPVVQHHFRVFSSKDGAALLNVSRAAVNNNSKDGASPHRIFEKPASPVPPKFVAEEPKKVILPPKPAFTKPKPNLVRCCCCCCCC